MAGQLVAAALLAALATVGVAGSSASAHAALVSSDPADGAKLDAMPGHVSLVFDEQVNPSMSQVIVSSGGIARDAENVGGNGTQVTATVPADVAPGQVSVLYKVVSADGHPVSGRVSFTVGGSGAGTSGPAQSASPAPTTVAPSRPAAQSSDDTGNGMMVALTVIAAVVLVVIGLLMVHSERRR